MATLYDDKTEQELMTDLKAGSVKALNAIYDRYARRLYAFIIPWVKSSQDTEEIVQDVFVNLWKYHKDIDPSRSLEALLFTIAQRYRINAVRSLTASPVYEDFLEYSNKLKSEDSDKLEYDDFLEQLKKAINSLTPSQKEIVKMSKFDNLSNGEIAEKLGISEKTVRNTLSAGLKTLRTLLSDTVLCLLMNASLYLISMQ